MDGGSLGDGFVLDIEGITATTGIFSYLSGSGPIPLGGSVSEEINSSLSSELVLVTLTNVPVLSAVWLFISSVIGLFGIKRKNSA